VLRAFPKLDGEERKGRIDGGSHLVFRLDLFLDDFVPVPVDSFAQLCSRFPQLRCLIVSMNWKQEDEVDGPEHLLSTLPAGLQHLFLVGLVNWRTPKCPLDLIATFLHEHQDLETLSLPFQFDDASLRLPQSKNPIGRSLRTIVLQHSSQAQAMARLAQGTFPQLISLNVLCMREQDDEQDHQNLFDFL
jgi:hypothetical protein